MGEYPAETDRCESGDQAADLDPSVARARNWEKVSADLGFDILRLVKITGTNPIYHMECEQGKIEFPNIKKLSSQSAFRNTVAAAINRYPRKLKGLAWEEISQLMLQSLTEEDGGEEMQLEGSARIHLNQYLNEVGFIDMVEGQSSQQARNPLILDSSITICASNFQLHMSKATGQNVSIQQAVGMLSAIGAKSFRHRGKFPEQSRWRLPVSEFDPAQFSAQYREDISDAA